ATPNNTPNNARKSALAGEASPSEINAATGAIPLDELIHEHEAAGRALARIRELTDDFVPPEYACNTWKGLWAGLEQLEREMHRHIHLENNILFPAIG
ncbi:MAG: hypothetical protein HKN17_06030, partial [Rhodothermales bacterium]|nr:hypothetical protein [Rhodothermales bacterium]